MILLDGKKVAASYREGLQSRIGEFTKKTNIQPGLAVVLVGEDSASQVYVRNKVKACEKVGIVSTEHRLPTVVTSDELKSLIDNLNQDSTIHGILVQLPLPNKLLNKDEVLSWIDPKKDPDGLTVENMGLFWAGHPRVVSCTPAGVMEILKYYNIEVAEKKAVVVGRSQIVGQPMALLLQNANATVSVCHSKTKDIRSFTKEADIVVVAVGVPEFLGKDDFKKEAIVVDVGIHRKTLEDGRSQLCGDIRFAELDGWVKAATPVPGGVGPMTITMLLENTFQLACISVLKK